MSKSVPCCVSKDKGNGSFIDMGNGSFVRDMDSSFVHGQDSFIGCLPLDPEKRARVVEKKVSSLRSGLESLASLVGNLNEEMARLRDENELYAHSNGKLAAENSKLAAEIEEDEAGPWGMEADILEEHYKRIEEHRRSMDSDEGDADSAGGSPRRPPPSESSSSRTGDGSKASSKVEADGLARQTTEYLEIHESSSKVEDSKRGAAVNKKHEGGRGVEKPITLPYLKHLDLSANSLGRGEGTEVNPIGRIDAPTTPTTARTMSADDGFSPLVWKLVA